MPTSSSMTRMRDFTLAGVDADGTNRSLIRSLIRAGDVHVDGEHVTFIRGARETGISVGRVYGAPVNLHHDVVALDAGVVRRTQRIDASDDDAVHAGR